MWTAFIYIRDFILTYFNYLDYVYYYYEFNKLFLDIVIKKHDILHNNAVSFSR